MELCGLWPCVKGACGRAYDAIAPSFHARLTDDSVEWFGGLAVGSDDWIVLYIRPHGTRSALAIVSGSRDSRCSLVVTSIKLIQLKAGHRDW